MVGRAGSNPRPRAYESYLDPLATSRNAFAEAVILVVRQHFCAWRYGSGPTPIRSRFAPGRRDGAATILIERR